MVDNGTLCESYKDLVREAGDLDLSGHRLTKINTVEGLWMEQKILGFSF